MSRFLVCEYMSSPVHVVHPHASLVEVYGGLQRWGISSLAVADEADRLVGVVSRTDLLRVGRRAVGSNHRRALLELPDVPVFQHMTDDPLTILPTATLSEAASLMWENRVHRLFVVDDGRLLGVLSVNDLVRAVGDLRITTPISQLATRPVVTVDVATPLSTATDLLAGAQVTGVVVVENEWPVGIFGQEEALDAQNLDRDTPVEDVMSFGLICFPEDTALHRAAAAAATMNVRRILSVSKRHIRGILTGLDVARVGLDLVSDVR